MSNCKRDSSADTEHTADYSNDTWLSLLGLLNWTEFFVTVDHSICWRKHLAWSRNGPDLRNYTVQKFSSSMVFMSLILGAELNVLFNSSNIMTDIRTQMLEGNYTSLRHWIGFVILLSACVTVVALVATFTAWGLVSAIGDRNTHCLLRSSIGQYVTALPSNFVVAALYLFLLCLILFIIELMSGPLQGVLVLLVLYLFFQVVISFSAFGRLILLTGAMSNRPVLDMALEKALLPSGLHASLLIKATDRKRRRTSVVSMYRSPSERKRKSNVTRYSQRGSQIGAELNNEANLTQVSSFSSRCSNSTFTLTGHTGPGDRHDNGNASPTESVSESTTQQSAHSTPMNSEDEMAIRNAARALSPKHCVSNHRTPPSETSSVGSLPDRFLNEQARDNNYGTRNNRGSGTDQEFHESFGSMVSFPRASILNRSIHSTELKKVVEQALSFEQDTCEPAHDGNNDNDATPLRSGVEKSVVRFSIHQPTGPVSSLYSDGEGLSRQGSRRSLFGATTKALSRRSLLAGFRQGSTRESIQQEWNEEEDVRDMYDIAPPAQVVFEEEEDEDWNDDTEASIDVFEHNDNMNMPHPNILNRVRRLKSLRNLASSGSLEAYSQSSREDVHEEQIEAGQVQGNEMDDRQEANERQYLLSERLP